MKFRLPLSTAPTVEARTQNHLLFHLFYRCAHTLLNGFGGFCGEVHNNATLAQLKNRPFKGERNIAMIRWSSMNGPARFFSFHGNTIHFTLIWVYHFNLTVVLLNVQHCGVEVVIMSFLILRLVKRLRNAPRPLLSGPNFRANDVGWCSCLALPWISIYHTTMTRGTTIFCLAEIFLDYRSMEITTLLMPPHMNVQAATAAIQALPPLPAGAFNHLFPSISLFWLNGEIFAHRCVSHELFEFLFSTVRVPKAMTEPFPPICPWPADSPITHTMTLPIAPVDPPVPQSIKLHPVPDTVLPFLDATTGSMDSSAPQSIKLHPAPDTVLSLTDATSGRLNLPASQSIKLHPVPDTVLPALDTRNGTDDSNTSYTTATAATPLSSPGSSISAHTLDRATSRLTSP